MEKSFRALRGFLAGTEGEEDTYFAYSATLRIFGDISNLDEISTKLGVQPTNSHRKGERRSDRAATYRHDMWSYSPAVNAPLAIAQPQRGDARTGGIESAEVRPSSEPQLGSSNPNLRRSPSGLKRKR
jgi:hypothetical protein